MQNKNTWPNSTPDKLNVDQAQIESLGYAVRKSKVKSCLILKEGRLIFQYYKSNKIRDNLQRINSCTKSIVSILIGIAIEKGFIPSVDMTMEHYFPDIMNSLEDSRKKAISIEHLLTMSVGLDWPEFGEWNHMPPMCTRDVVKFVFDRPLVDEPGTRMNYNSGCSHVLSAILKKATGMKTSVFADKYLFEPLGIDKDYHWFEDANGINYGSDGLRLLPYDMAKFGQLFLQEGIWKEKEIISAEWIRRSTEPYLLTYDYIGHYAFHWWVAKIDPNHDDFTLNNKMFFAMGLNGQFIIVIPSLQTVVVFTSTLDNTIKPLDFVREFIVKSMGN
ncbi:6-aminohexanoate-dimer hydrolase [Paenibacillus pseudetheri]|uniref:6-aminohexanoate-dimer hydrolase n=1 Tax=Paenibacillus pseudetheri TaxID=2897682 RepID=A0ABN8FM19_9BACL|nr:6-aminohexanoate-dimer hydrolase [Paenibacillus pseudetheri]